MFGGRPRSFDLFEDVRRLGGPDERLGIEVVDLDVALDCRDQIPNAREGASANSLVGEISEEALDHVEPRRSGRREVHVEPRVPSEPSLHFSCL